MADERQAGGRDDAGGVFVGGDWGGGVPSLDGPPMPPVPVDLAARRARARPSGATGAAAPDARAAQDVLRLIAGKLCADCRAQLAPDLEHLRARLAQLRADGGG